MFRKLAISIGMAAVFGAGVAAAGCDEPDEQAQQQQDDQPADDEQPEAQQTDHELSEAERMLAELPDDERETLEETVSEIQDELPERELHRRRHDLWEDHDLPEGGQWEPPGPFEDERDVVEAQFVDEALDALFDETDAFRRPTDPGYEAWSEQQQADGEVPDGLGEIRLGDELDSDEIQQIEDEDRTIELLGVDATITPVVDVEDRVVRLVYHDHWESTIAETVDGAHSRLLPMTIAATRLVDQLGEPQVDSQPRPYGTAASGEPWFDEQMYWEGDEHTIELNKTADEGGASQVELVLRDSDPERVCGPQDGFDDWYEQFEEVIESDDPGEAVDYFSFPFEASVEPAPGEIVFADEEEFQSWHDDQFGDREFENRDEFVAEASLEELKPSERFDHPLCPTTEYGYWVPLDSEPYGSLVFQPIDGEWKAVGLR